METCPRCGDSGNCNLCDGYGYEFAGDGEGCQVCGHSGDCPTCSGMGHAAAPAALLLTHVEN
jgi:hypothetical protein